MKETIMINGKEQDNIIQPPFTKKYSDEDREETGAEILSLRINKKERELIDQLKEILHYSQDAKVIKISLIVSRNVILGTFGADLISRVCAEDRRRPISEGSKDPKI